MVDEVRWEGERPDVVGFPGAGPVADQALGRQHLGLLPIHSGGIVVAVEAEGDRGQAEGVGEGFGEVPTGAGEWAFQVIDAETSLTGAQRR